MNRVASCLVSIVLLAVSAPEGAQPRPQQQQQTKAYSPIEQQLARGVNLFATDDDSNEAERLFLKVIGSKPVTTKEGEAAVYYLGRYYHRNANMLRQPALLNQAVSRYKQIHLQVDSRKTPSTWYAEARFYKGLVYLQQGQWEDAVEAVDHIDTRLDGTADIDYLVWSYDKRLINKSVPTQTLKDEYRRIVNAYGVLRRPKGVADRATFDQIVRDLEGALGRKALSRAY